jgi:hypothetical protein
MITGFSCPSLQIRAIAWANRWLVHQTQDKSQKISSLQPACTYKQVHRSPLGLHTTRNEHYNAAGQGHDIQCPQWEGNSQEPAWASVAGFQSGSKSTSLQRLQLTLVASCIQKSHIELATNKSVLEKSRQKRFWKVEFWVRSVSDIYKPISKGQWTILPWQLQQ